MHLSTIINSILLCVLNASFMVAGITLNFVVIISLWRSSQLRKKLCYFMILASSGFDLAVVTIVQPLLILSIILWSMQMYHAGIETLRKYAFIFFVGFSMFALLTLNIERFLALTCPFFHQAVITKGKLAIFLALQMLITVSVMGLYYFYPKTDV